MKRRIAGTANQAPSAPTDADPSADSGVENAASATRVGVTAHAVDPDGDAVAYHLSDDAGGRFATDAATGVVTVATALGGPATRSITVAASDGTLSASALGWRRSRQTPSAAGHR